MFGLPITQRLQRMNPKQLIYCGLNKKNKKNKNKQQQYASNSNHYRPGEETLGV